MDFNDLCSKLKTGELNIFVHIDHTLRSIEQKESKIMALLPEEDRHKRLYKDAELLIQRYPDQSERPPLFGVLFGVKDLFNVEGLPTRAGSQLPAKAFLGPEASVVSALKSLGAIVLGKTVSTEFAYFSPGPTRNPLNPNHTPGGSSSGSAAAVAAGYCPFALGTQTIASIIRPASYCGVYGYKPSYGLISTSGVFPFSQTADHIGFIADSLATLLTIGTPLGIHPQSTRTPPLSNLGCIRGDYLLQAGESARASYQDAIKRLKTQGIAVIELDPFEDIARLNNLHKRLIAAEFYLNHKVIYAQYGHLYSQQSVELYKSGEEVSSDDLNDLRSQALELRAMLSELLSSNQISAILTPSTTSSAPEGLLSTGSPLMSLPWTNAGLPSLTLPFGKAIDGLPLGLQMIGSFNEDRALLETAFRIETALWE